MAVKPYTPSTGAGATTNTQKYVPTALDPALGTQAVPGQTIGNAGGTYTQFGPADPGQANFKASDDADFLSALADRLGIDPEKAHGQSLLQMVTAKLSEKYGVQDKEPGGEDVKKVKPGGQLPKELPFLNQEQTETVSTPGGDNAKALQEVAAKLGADGTKDPIAAIAEKLGVKAGPPGSNNQQSIQEPTSANETVAENYANFTKKLAAGGIGAGSFGAGWAKSLEQAGFLDAQQGNGTPSANDVETAYKKLLEESVYTKTNPSQVIVNHTNLNSTEAKAGGSSEAEAYIAQEAATYGVGLNQAQITGLANQFAAQAGGNGLSAVADQVRAAIVQLYDPTNPNNPPGLADSIATGIQDAANRYQVPLSQGAIGNLVKNALNSGATNSTDAVAQATQTLQQQAAGLYPTLAPQILAGTDVKTLTDPYFQIAQTYTGTPASTMQADDPTGKWSAFLQGGKDPKTGAPSVMTLDQWKKTIMQSPTDAYGFQKSQGGQDMAEQLSSAILNEFGRVTTSGSGNQGIGASSYNATPGSANTT